MQLINSFAIVAVAVAGVYAQGPQINTPASVVQCQPAQITYGGGQAPYFISVLPGGQVGAAPLEDLGQQSGSSLTWKVDLAQGTSITFQIRDSQGVVAFSAPISVQGSSDSSCVGKNSQTPSGTGSAPSSTGSTSSGASSGASTTPASTTAASSSTSAPATTSRATTSAASSLASSPTTPATSRPAGSATTSAASSTPSNAAATLLPGTAAGLFGALLAAVIA